MNICRNFKFFIWFGAKTLVHCQHFLFCFLQSFIKIMKSISFCLNKISVLKINMRIFPINHWEIFILFYLTRLVMSRNIRSAGIFINYELYYWSMRNIKKNYNFKLIFNTFDLKYLSFYHKSYSIIPISLQLKVVDLRYFKRWILLDQSDLRLTLKYYLNQARLWLEYKQWY